MDGGDAGDDAARWMRRSQSTLTRPDPLSNRPSSFTEFYRVLPSFTEFYRVVPSFTELYRVLPSFTECYRVLPSFTHFYLVLASFSEFHLVLPSFTEFYRVSDCTSPTMGFASRARV